ncbi:MAG TPA: amidophosphoribosyltransferase [Candidatus Avimonas sp.]|jgi:amidophosphoribosyltransferase|nr:amidophosphoribosyltransferase [Clostridiales bacterium]HOB36289.1 amidophosphoribosyltransferase [Candidatus Avimonas sp.]HQA16245.1 amidophosphoribosyltransferase [Candidatus Avimonas sp.]
MFDKIREECGVFGIFDPVISNVARSTYLALYAIQHRGQESCGIAVNEDGVFRSHRAAGLVPEVFDAETLEKLGKGNMAVGHVRYLPAKNFSIDEIQPLVVHHVKGSMAIAYNGNIMNASQLRRQYELEGAIFHGESDSEVIAYAITKARLQTDTIEEAVEKAMTVLQGAFSIVIMTSQELIAVRDPYGFRPLCMGKTHDGAAVFASESCALDSINADFVRDVDPGEIVVVSEQGINPIRTHCGKKGRLCIFEFVYFARPDSVIEQASVYEARLRAGAFLALEHPVQADVVIGVPDSGLDAALGYARQSGIPYGVGFIKNRYVGRSFIQPSQGQREEAVKVKLNVVRSVVEGKRVVLIDDSIVRGTTSARIVRLLRESGATEVHMLVSSPPFRFPCYFGTDIKSQDKLIAHRYSSVDEIAGQIGVDSLGYLSVENVKKIAKNARCGFCDGCFTGRYPVKVPDSFQDNGLFE